MRPPFATSITVGRQHVAEPAGRHQVDAEAGRDRQLVVRIAGVREAGVGERRDQAAMAGVVAVEHVFPHASSSAVAAPGRTSTTISMASSCAARSRAYMPCAGHGLRFPAGSVVTWSRGRLIASLQAEMRDPRGVRCFGRSRAVYYRPVGRSMRPVASAGTMRQVRRRRRSSRRRIDRGAPMPCYSIDGLVPVVDPDRVRAPQRGVDRRRDRRGRAAMSARAHRCAATSGGS